MPAYLDGIRASSNAPEAATLEARAGDATSVLLETELGHTDVQTIARRVGLGADRRMPGQRAGQLLHAVQRSDITLGLLLVEVLRGFRRLGPRVVLSADVHGLVQRIGDLLDGERLDLPLRTRPHDGGHAPCSVELGRDLLIGQTWHVPTYPSLIVLRSVERRIIYTLLYLHTFSNFFISPTLLLHYAIDESVDKTRANQGSWAKSC